MNTPEYKKAYLANLKLEIANNKKHLMANKGDINPATQQYIQNTGKTILGLPTFIGETNIQSNKTKSKGSK